MFQTTNQYMSDIIIRYPFHIQVYGTNGKYSKIYGIIRPIDESWNTLWWTNIAMENHHF